MGCNDWQQKLAKRGVAFFLFLSEWAEYVSNTVIASEHLPWSQLPGYGCLLQSLVIEMK